ncbi:cyanoexosortase C [Leptolyngbya sp. NK1-12]|uniref:Cyanoexosortase C n=1 Tax=Leptolyngbya sp. NK1-12 TaxID=2547451 RepID=A0AA96WQB5_9CYAN|nr:cyanoexosortase C [Leptolyngbya sp. NK1-12]WNZ27291.1 cyanoexosortase C [Leptolyngbya sp. NK1-12]
MKSNKAGKARKARQIAQDILRECLRTPHNRIVSCGILVGFFYLPSRLLDLITATLRGTPSILMTAAIGLGLHMLWQKRHQLAKLQVSEADRLLGHLLIIGGIILAPAAFWVEWSQRLDWAVILIGIACSCWGMEFFRLYPLPTFLIGMGLFPQPFQVAKEIWQAFLPPQILERFMAWAGNLGLLAIGQPSVLQSTAISLPGGTVDVQWGCNGFDMMLTMAAASLVLGLFLQQSALKITGMIVVGMVLALLFNIPRIMLMAMAEAYWGKAAFEFWHGAWGGQIFSTLLFTIYYYVVMALVKRSSIKSTVHSR